MADSSHSCIPEENENISTCGSLKSAAMLGIALSVGASGVIVSQSEASAAVSVPTTHAAETLPTAVESVTTEATAADDSEVAALHTVESGQSLWQIAQQHGVGLRELKSANSLSPETSIRVGQVLKVPADAQRTETDSASFDLLAKLTNTEAAQTVEVQAEAVRPTATLPIEADADSAEVELSQNDTQANTVQGIRDASFPEASSAEISIEIADASPEVLQPEASATTEPVITALATPSSFSHYQVRSGDTLSKIAASLGTTSEELIRANALANPNVILAGDTLRVPTAAAYIPAQTASSTTASSTLARSSSQSLQNEDAELLDELREAAPQEPASVGGERVATKDLLSSRPGRSESIDPYVANLLEEVQEIRRRSVETSEVETAIDETVAVEESNAVSDSPSLLARRDRATSPSSLSERIARSEVATTTPNNAQEANADLLAAAPLSPDAYIPAQRPSAGQVVSPDMPILPDADEYLPEAPDYFDGYIWPARGTLTSGYGWRWGRMHRGVDVAGPVGTPIVAAGAGVVERAGWNSGGYGNLVEIRHADGSLTRYAHNNSISVSVGQSVRQGQQIAEMGSTGYSTGPHLHFEIHTGAGAVNPMAYLPNR